MGVIVQKYGGSSVADVSRIKKVAGDKRHGFAEIIVLEPR